MLNKKIMTVPMLFFILIILIFIIIYYKYNNISIPNCHASVKILYPDNDENINGSYLFSLIHNSNDPNHISLLITGEVSSDNKKYFISRKYLMSYERWDEKFFLRVESTAISPNDQLNKKINLIGIPQNNQLYLINVKRLTDKQYVFEENLTPLFICTL